MPVTLTPAAPGEAIGSSPAKHLVFSGDGIRVIKTPV
jgi:hypothetical protein